MTDRDMERISSLKQQGKSAAAIAEMLCLPLNTVKSYLRRHPGTEDAHICPQCGKAVAQNKGRKEKRFCSDKCRMDKTQPIEYEEIFGGQNYTNDEAMIIHLLMVRPSMAGKGIASSLIRYAEELARNHSCKVLRLDTGKQNIPAVSLYKKMGFQSVATASMKVGAAIEHSGHLFFEKVL